MSKRLIFAIIGIVIVLVLIIGGYLIFSGKPASAPGNNNSNSQNQTLGTVNIQMSAFDPVTITVKKGDTVTWQNNDSYTHHLVADDGSFDLGDQSGGAKVQFTFDKVGTFNYHCSIHTYMKGVVIVK